MKKVRINDKTISVYIYSSDNEKKDGIIVLHAWWGLNDFFRIFSDRLLKEGFFVVTPDLYEGKIATTVTEAEKYRSIIDRKHVNSVLKALIPYIRSQ